jgi:hypothetical protein
LLFKSSLVGPEEYQRLFIAQGLSHVTWLFWWKSCCCADGTGVLGFFAVASGAIQALSRVAASAPASKRTLTTPIAT